MPRVFLFAFAALLAALPLFQLGSAEPAKARPDGLYAEFTTPKGVIVCELFYRETPLTVINFVALAEGKIAVKSKTKKTGEPFFDDLTFNRVVPNFVIQGGDPLNDPTGENDGGPGYEFEDEFLPQLRHEAGALSMANDGPRTNGSQFFICHLPVHRLNYLHTVFGRVVEGMDVVNRIAQGDKIETVRILRVGEAAKKFEANTLTFEINRKRMQLVMEPNLPTEGFKHLVDGTKSLPDFRVKNFNYKLANYEKFRRLRLVVRIFDEEKAADVDLKKLVAETGAGDQTGMLLCYFAQEDEWRLMVGKDLFAVLNRGVIPPDTDTFVKNELHARKQAFLAPARALTAEWKEKRKAGAASANPPAIAGAPSEPFPQLKDALNAAIGGLILACDEHALGRVPKAPGE